MDWPVLSSSRALPALLICRRSLASLRYKQTTPSCRGRSKVKRSPALFHVRNCSATETAPDDHEVGPGNWRKLWESVNVRETENGSAQEKVTLPWGEREKRRKRWCRKRDRKMMMKEIIKHEYAWVAEADAVWLDVTKVSSATLWKRTRVLAYWY